MALPNLKLSLIVEALDRATAPLRGIEHGLEALERRTNKLQAAAHKLGLAEFIGGAALAGAAAEGVHAVVELTNKTAELGETVLHGATKAGLTVEQYQRLSFAAKQLGVDQDSLSQVFFRFQTHLSNAIAGSKETRAALKELGITSQATAKRLARDPQEAFLRLVDGFTSIANPSTRARVALELFSRSGYQILPMLMAGRAEIVKFMGQLDKAHAVMTEGQAKAAEEYIQKQHQMALAVQGLQMQIGVRLVPVMTKAIDKLTEWIDHLQEGAVQRFTARVEQLVARLPELMPKFERLGELALSLADKLLALSEHAKVVKGILAALAVLVSAQLLIAFVSLVATIGSGVVAFAGFVAVITSLIGLSAGIATFADAMALLDLALDANPVGVLVIAIGLLVAAIAAIGLAVVEVVKHWSGITAFFGGLWKSIEGIFASAWKRITDLTPDWLKTLLKIGASAITIGAGPLAAPLALAQPLLGPPAAAQPVLRPHPAVHPGAPGAAVTSRADVHLHVTTDGAAKVQTRALKGEPGVAVSVHRGQMPD